MLSTTAVFSPKIAKQAAEFPKCSKAVRLTNKLLHFQENTSMKKMLVVLSMIALISAVAFAAPKPFTANFDGYCDSITINPTAAPVSFGGTHNLYDCANTEAIGGFKHGLNAAFQYPGSIGSVYDVSDEAFGLQGAPYSLQYEINKTYHTWTLYIGFDGVGNYLGNEGTWTQSAAPVKNGSTKATSHLK